MTVLRSIGEWLWEPRSRKQLKVYAVVLAVGTIWFAVIATGNLTEANFTLADESPLPNWFTLPAGTDRAGVSMILDTYPDGQYRMRLVRRSDGSALATATVEVTNRVSATSNELEAKGAHPESGVTYVRVRVGDSTDVIAIRNMHSTVWVIHDPQISAAIDKIAKERSSAQKEESR